MTVSTITPGASVATDRSAAKGWPRVCRGSYGLQLAGQGDAARALEEAGRWMLPSDPGWPVWHVEWTRLESTPAPGHRPLRERQPPVRDELLADSARLATSPGEGWIELDRLSRRTRFWMPEPVAPAALVHPYLTSTAAIAAHWLGRAPFHAGGFAVDGHAWGVLGGREMGKSSLLMGLHAAGAAIVSDDLMVLVEGHVYSGPRCLDLREGAADRFGAGEPLGRVGRRERWRVDLPPVPGELPLSGWVVLGWSDTVSIEPIGAADRLAALATNRAIIAKGEAPRGLLDAASLPVVVFSRPRDWSRMDEGLRHLLTALASGKLQG